MQGTDCEDVVPLPQAVGNAAGEVKPLRPQGDNLLSGLLLKTRHNYLKLIEF